jgi:hypothetical protein
MGLVTVSLDRIHTVIARLKAAGFKVVMVSVRNRLILIEGEVDFFGYLLSAPVEGIEHVEMVGETA